MKMLLQLFICAFVFLASGCQSLDSSAMATPKAGQALVNGVMLKYLEQGQGVPVVFVHGAFSDHRNWEAQRAEVAVRYRYIALDQRYFGLAPWSDDATKYSLASHANDLVAFIEQLKAGPVHLVGWSYGGAIALVVAAQRPELVRSLFLNEPSLGTIVSDPTDQATLAEERKGIAPALAASKASNQAQAVQIFADWVNVQPGSFDALPAPMRNVHLENARTLPAHFASPPPPAISCSQVGKFKFPVTVTKGQQSRKFFTILADTTHRCIPGSRLIVIPNARHMAPVQNTAAFNAALLVHLDGR